MPTTQSAFAAEFLRRAAAAVSEHREELMELDRAIGDADHGENLDRGFSAALERVVVTSESTHAEVLRGLATTLMSVVGGAAGPLYGTAFLRAAKAVGGDDAGGEEDASDAELVAAALGAASEGIQARGKAVEGEATMVDAWAPAARAAREAADAGRGALDVLRAAAEAAAQGAQATEPMTATKGRASYLGERSIGHRDPGAQSSAILLAVAADAARAVCSGTGGGEPSNASDSSGVSDASGEETEG